MKHTLQPWLESRRKTSGVILALLLLAIANSIMSNSLSAFELFEGGADTATTVSDTILTWLVNLTIIGIVLCWLLNWEQITRWLMFIYTSIASLDVSISVFMVLVTIAQRKGNAGAYDLLVDAGLLWITNLILFAIWYWLVDGGGRSQRMNHPTSTRDFWFPQQANEIRGYQGWEPRFFDYVYLAFNCSITFGTGEVLALSHRGKVLVIIQVSHSVVMLVFLVSRAINLVTS